MNDNFILINKYKKTIEYILKITDNYPHKELELKTRILNTTYDILETMYISNIDKKYLNVIPKIKMLDFYIYLSYKKGIVSKRRFEVVGNFLLESTKMIFGLINA